MSTPKSILIAGAGIAGPALAILLNNNGFKTTIVERASDVRRAGQQVDVAGPGIELVCFLGVEEAIKARTVGDEGIRFVDNENKPYAAFPASSSTVSLVREIEIMRGDMADVLYQASKAQTDYIFNDRITSLSESADGITVSFKNSPDTKFDLVVAADGLSSRTREVAFGASKDSVVKNLGQWGALFNIPHAPQDGTWSRVYIAPGGRVVCLRPDFKRSQTSVYLAQGSFDVSIASKSVDEQKAHIQRLFQDAGWETKRVLSHMHSAGNFYVQQVAQVKMPSLSKGRVVLLGDAGYCPSPVSGLGTTMAYIGAYVLAGCLIAHRDDLPKALEQYEKDLRPFVDSAQSLGPGVPGIATPHSEWAVWLTTSAIGAVGSTVKFVQATGIGTLLGWVFWPLSLLLNRVGWLGGVQSMKLPVYESMRGAGGMRWSGA